MADFVTRLSQEGPHSENAQGVSLSTLFGECHRAFIELFLVLSGESYEDTSMASLISNEYGRLGVWGSNAGADRQGRGSLDDRLRNDRTVYNMVSQSLNSLYLCVAQGIELANNPEVSHKEDEAFDIPDGMSDFGSETSTDSTEGTSPIDSVLAAIVLQVQSLYESSALLRRPEIPDKYIRSVAKNTTSISNLFGPWDIAHVVEKVTQWHAENDRKLEGSLKFDDWLCVRLGAGNTRRREQLMYWQRHPEQGSSMKIHAETLPLGRSASQKFAVDPATVSVAPTLGNTIAHNTPASEFTAQSFSVVARSVLKDTATISGRPKTTYAASDYRPEATEIRVPDFPKAEKGAVTVPCPYCFTQLNVKEMGNQRELWKKHVFRDLRPYQCTWEHCSHSEKLYVTRHDWIFHETQIHRRQWTCRDCDESFKSKTSIENHLRSRHLGTFTEKQLPILLNLCERAVEPNTPTECPLCEKILPLASLRDGYDLQSHLAWHLEQIALFVISKSDVDEASDADEAHSNKAAQGVVDDADETHSNKASQGVIDDADEAHSNKAAQGVVGDAEAAQLLGLEKDTKDSGNNQTEERDVVTEFRRFAASQKAQAERLRMSKQKSDKEEKLQELEAFASSFKLQSPIPRDLVPIVTKDPAKRRAMEATLGRLELDKAPTEEAQVNFPAQNLATGSPLTIEDLYDDDEYQSYDYDEYQSHYSYDDDEYQSHDNEYQSHDDDDALGDDALEN